MTHCCTSSILFFIYSLLSTPPNNTCPTWILSQQNNSERIFEWLWNVGSPHPVWLSVPNLFCFCPNRKTTPASKSDSTLASRMRRSKTELWVHVVGNWESVFLVDMESSTKSCCKCDCLSLCNAPSSLLILLVDSKKKVVTLFLSYQSLSNSKV